MQIKPRDNRHLAAWLAANSLGHLLDGFDVDDKAYAERLDEAHHVALPHGLTREEDRAAWRHAWAAYTLASANRVSKELAEQMPGEQIGDMRRFAEAAETQARAFNAHHQRLDSIAQALEDVLTIQAHHYQRVEESAQAAGRAAERMADEQAERTRMIVAAAQTVQLQLAVNKEHLAEVSKHGTAGLVDAVNNLLVHLRGVHEEEARWRAGVRKLLTASWVLGAILTILLILALLTSTAHAQVTQTNVRTVGGVNVSDAVNSAVKVNVVAGAAGGGTAQLAVRDLADTSWVNVGFEAALARVPMDLFSVGGTAVSGANVVDAGNTAFRVNCVIGCGAAGFTDNGVFTGGTSGVNPMAALYDATPPAITDGSAGILRMNASRILYVDLSQTAANATAVKVDNSAVTQPISGTVTVTDGAGALNTIVDSGTLTAVTSITNPVGVTGTFWQATQPVSGTFWQATQPVSSTQLPAALDGLNLKVHEQGTVPVTGTFWQATQPVSGTFWQATQPVSGTVTVTDGAGVLNVIVDSGTTAVTQATATNLRIAGGDAAGAPTAGTVLAVQGIASGTAVPVSGTFWQATQPVSGTFWQATQPVSGTVTVTDGAGALNVIVDSGTTTVTQGTGTNLHTVVDSGSITAVQGTGTNLHTVVDSGTITANAGTGYGGCAGATVANTTTVAINTASAATVALVAASGATVVYVCAYNFMSAGTTNVTLEYGTGATCGTGTTVLTGAYPLIAQTGVAYGNGAGVVLKTPASQALCIVNSQAIQISGSITYAQF